MAQQYPDGFLWGASTAAHQVEGNTNNQWTAWEKANAARLAKCAQQRFGNLLTWKMLEPEAVKPDNYLSGESVQHFERYEEDFAILKRLNMNAYRFSIEWSRIEPREGEWDAAAIAHYRKYILRLKELGIEPVVTLWHWTMPVWFVEKGAFEKQANLKYFDRYVAKMMEEYGRDLKYVITLNEPSAFVGMGYLNNEWPPQHRNPLLGVWVYWNLCLAHKRAYAVIKRVCPQLSVSIAAHLVDVRPIRPHSRLNRLVAAFMTYVSNWWLLDRIKRSVDFMGVNYYFTLYADWRGKVTNPQNPHNDLGWYMEPARIGALLEAVWARYRMPIIITENGLADGADAQRQWWLEQTLSVIQFAIAGGVDIRGYLHWSLMDNFEWAYGWLGKFGLASVDRKSLKRTVRPSALWFANYIKDHRSSAQPEEQELVPQK